jgi:hypothetical protein
MARRTDLARTLVLVGPNTTADGSRIRCMEWESTDGLMGLFIKEVLQMAILMACLLNGLLMETSTKALIRTIKKKMVSILFIIKQLETQLTPNIKMISLKDYTHYINQMESFGTLFQKTKNMALRFCKTMILSSRKLAIFARDSLRKRPSRSLRALLM